MSSTNIPHAEEVENDFVNISTSTPTSSGESTSATSVAETEVVTDIHPIQLIDGEGRFAFVSSFNFGFLNFLQYFKQ